MKKKSFFERLTGAVNADVEDVDFEIEDTTVQKQPTAAAEEEAIPNGNEWMEEEVEDAQLTVDVYNKPDEIVVQTIVAGVAPGDLDISITREMVTIRGKREHHEKVEAENYFHEELFWGSFSRSIVLPEEVDVEEAEAEEKHGLLTIHLPKIDKKKQTRLKVKSK